MKFYKIETQSGEELITNINEDNIVESLVQTNLREIDAETVKKYNLKAGMKISDIDSIKDEDGDNADIIANASFAPCYIYDYINLSELSDDCLYTDSYTEELYTKCDIKSWDADEYIWEHDGSNWRMTKIMGIYKIEVEEVENENYDTGRIETYKTPKGNLIKIGYSMYQGSRDSVIEGDEFVEDEAKWKLKT